MDTVAFNEKTQDIIRVIFGGRDETLLAFKAIRKKVFYMVFTYMNCEKKQKWNWKLLNAKPVSSKIMTQHSEERLIFVPPSCWGLSLFANIAIRQQVESNKYDSQESSVLIEKHYII